jgi:hypothetical protein
MDEVSRLSWILGSGAPQPKRMDRKDVTGSDDAPGRVDRRSAGFGGECWDYG